MTAFTESTVESAALAWLEAIGWQVVHGPDIAPDMPAAEWADYGEDAFRKLTRPEGADQIQRNRQLQTYKAEVTSEDLCRQFLRTAASGERRAERRSGSLGRAA